MGLNLRSMDDDPNNAWSRWRAAAAAPASASNGGINVNVSVGSLGGGGGGHGGFSWEEAAFAEDSGSTWPPRSYSCNFCRKEFRSAQALGGHMNIHRRDRARLRQGISLGSAGTVPQQQQHQQRNSDEFSGGGGGAPAPQPPDLRAVVPGLISWPHLGADQGFNIKHQQQQNQVFWQSKAANFYRGSSSNLPAACSSSASCVSPPSTVLSMSLFSNSKNPTTTSSVYQYHHHHQYPNNWQQQQQCLHPIIQSEILVSSDSSDSSELLEPSKYRQSMDFHVGYAGSRNTEHSNLRDMAAPEDDDAEGGEEEEEEEEELDLELRLGDSRRPPLNKIPSSNGGF